MKPVTAILFGLCFLFVTSSLEAQKTERVQRRAKDKANQRIDQKVDDAVDRAAEKLESLFRKKKKTEPEETPKEEPEVLEEEIIEFEDQEIDEEEAVGILSKIGFGGEFEPYENPVTVSMSLDMIVTNNKGKETKSIVHYALDTWATGVLMETEEGQSRILYDNKEGYMTVINEAEGGNEGFRMRQPTIDYDAIMGDEAYEVTALSGRRTIDGYDCREYRVVHKYGTTTTWVTNDLDVDMEVLTRAMLSQSKQGGGDIFRPLYEMEGFPIEATTVSANEKETTVVHYYNIKVGEDIDKSVFDTTGVEIKKMGF